MALVLPWASGSFRRQRYILALKNYENKFNLIPKQDCVLHFVGGAFVLQIEVLKLF